MDLPSILTTLWGKITDPLSYILVGLVFLFPAPETYRWVGWIFVALGISGFCKWLYPHILSARANRKIKKKIKSLSKKEFQLLNFLRVNEGISIDTERGASSKDKEKFGMLMSFEGKKLVEKDNNYNFSGGMGHSFHLPYMVEKALRDLIETSARQ